MYKLKFTNKEMVKRYISDISSIYFISVLRGEAEGTIWADKEVNPDLLIVWSEYQKGFQIMGEPLDEKEWGEFNKWFKDVMMPFLESKEIDVFEYGVDHKKLAIMMSRIFKHKDIEYEKQKIFEYDGNIGIIRKPEGYTYEKIDTKFLQKEYDNMAYITDELNIAYGNSSNTLEKIYGYAAIRDHKIVAKAIMLFNYEDIDNIGVDTLEEYRMNGLASYLVSRTIQETLKINHKPIWDCTQDNVASNSVAKKCGFKMIREDEIYYFSI